MKNLKWLTAALFLISVGLDAQVSYNPFTQNIRFDPEPTAQGYVCGFLTEVVFTQGLTTADDAALFATEPLKVNICIGGFTFATTNISTLVTGSYASNFNWAIDNFSPNCLIGTQKQVLNGTGYDPLNLNPLASGDIRVKLKVPESSPISTVLGANVTLQVPPYMALQNSSPDDNEATQTQSYCPLKIAGAVFNDTVKNDGTIYSPGSVGLSNPDGNLLHANLIDVATGVVIATVPLNPNGTYEFLAIPYNNNFVPIEYTVSLSLTPGSIGSIPPPVNLPGIWVHTGESPCNLSGFDGNANGRVSFNVTNFSRFNADFGIYKPNPTGPLPIVLKNFYATEVNCTGVLSWTTSSEMNLSHIEILRRSPGKDFDVIHSEKASGGAAVEHTYTYTDKQVINDVRYEYQLRFVDFDQQINMTSVQEITVNCGNVDANISLFPNPVLDELSILYVSLEDNNMLQLEVLDATGRKLAVLSQIVDKGNNVIPMNLSHLATGYYFINYHVVENGDGGSVKFLKD